jgi:hypothetical protein
MKFMESTNAKHSKQVMYKPSTTREGETLQLFSSCMSHAMLTSLVTYYSSYFSLLKNMFIFCAMAGGKHASEGKSEPSRKGTATDLELKIRMIRKYGGGQSSSTIVH